MRRIGEYKGKYIIEGANLSNTLKKSELLGSIDASEKLVVKERNDSGSLTVITNTEG